MSLQNTCFNIFKSSESTRKSSLHRELLIMPGHSDVKRLDNFHGRCTYEATMPGSSRAYVGPTFDTFRKTICSWVETFRTASFGMSSTWTRRWNDSSQKKELRYKTKAMKKVSKALVRSSISQYLLCDAVFKSVDPRHLIYSKFLILARPCPIKQSRSWLLHLRVCASKCGTVKNWVSTSMGMDVVEQWY